MIPKRFTWTADPDQIIAAVDRVIVMEIPVRMRQTCTATETEESQSDFLSRQRPLAIAWRHRRGRKSPLLLST